MNIFKHEFYLKKKSVFIWSLSISFFIMVYMAFFPSISKDRASMDSIMNSLPAEMLEAFGIREGLSIGSINGYFTLTFTMVLIAIAIQSSNYGVSILSAEERELTADFLLSKPVSRARIYLSKFFASLLGLLITAIIVSLTSYVSLIVFSGDESFNLLNIIKVFIALSIFQLIFLSLGMLISMIFKKIRSVVGFSMGLSIGLYVISAVSNITSSNHLKYLSPFNYFETGEILKTGLYDINLLLTAISTIILSLTLSFILYNKRDINSI